MYHLPQLYADMHRTVTEDLEFYRELAESRRRPGCMTGNSPVASRHPEADAHRVRVLELGCGTGRIASALAAAGHEVAGIDVSEEMLAFAAQCGAGGARKSWDSHHDCPPNAARTPNLRLIRADMRDFDLAERFDLIILGLNGVGHLLTDSDLAAMFGCVARHLAVGGFFVLHLFTAGSGVAPDGGGLVHRALVYSGGRELSWYEMRTIGASGADDRSPRYEHLSWYFYNDEPEAEPTVASLELRIHQPDQICAIASEAGLTLVRELAGFETGAPADSPDWIGVWERGAPLPTRTAASG